jgi:hypothetical protein
VSYRARDCHAPKFAADDEEAIVRRRWMIHDLTRPADFPPRLPRCPGLLGLLVLIIVLLLPAVLGAARLASPLLTDFLDFAGPGDFVRSGCARTTPGSAGATTIRTQT